MTDRQPSQGRSPWVIRLAAVGLVVLVALGAAMHAAEARVEEELKEVRYHARILSVTPDEACLKWVRSSGGRLFGNLLKIARELPFPIHNLPADDAAEPGEQGEGVVEPECNATVQVEAGVSNPLPLGLHARILGVQARVANQRLEADQIEFANPSLDAAGGESLNAQVTLRLRIEQILAGASQIVLRRKLPLEASVEAEVSALGGLMARRLVLPLKRELTESELRSGAITGTIAAQE